MDFRGPRFSGLWQLVAPDGDGVVPPKQLVLEASGLVILKAWRLGGLGWIRVIAKWVVM